MGAALPFIAVAATLVGAGISYMGVQQQASAQSQQLAYNAQVAKNNQVIADNAANDAIARGNIAEQEKANQTSAVMGRQRAALAANGVDVDTGTAVNLQSDTAAAGTLDQLTLHSNALREAAGYTNQGINYQNQAQLDEASSANALSAGDLKGGGTIATAAGSVASQWYNFNYGTRQQQPGSAGIVT